MFLPVTILLSKLKIGGCLPSDPLSPDYQPVLADPDPPVKINTQDEEPNPQDRRKNTVPTNPQFSLTRQTHLFSAQSKKKMEQKII